MKTKSLILLIISVLLVLTLASCRDDETVDIFADGKTDYVIVTAEGATEEEQALAKELAALSGANPEIVTDVAEEAAHEILIGNTNRAATAKVMTTLGESVTLSAFHYIIAEEDGKLVILSDDEVGYIYALDYIKATYIKDKSFSITADICDIKEVAWDEYYASELYYDRLIAEADKDRFDFLKDQLQNSGNDSDGNSITTVTEAVAAYKKLISSFDSSVFGEYRSTDFTAKDVYDAPTVYPKESHPRIYFTDNKSSDSEKSSLDKVRDTLTSDQNSIAYKRYIALSNVACDGKFKSTGYTSHNFDTDIVAKIEAKAFRYIMEKGSSDPSVAENAKMFGYEAIYAIKNAMVTLDLPESWPDGSREFGYLLAVVGYVYDWCYDLLTTEDKAQIIAGGVNLVGKHLEIVRYDGTANKAPTAQDPAHDHGAEYQMLHAYLTFAIACWGDTEEVGYGDEIYELVGGRILNNYADMQNWYAQSGSYWQGSNYGPFRGGATLLANLLINRMRDGEVTPFENFDKVATTITYYYRPDGTSLHIGDYSTDGRKVENHYFDACFMLYASALYESSYFKSFAYKFSNGFSDYTGMKGGTVGVSPTLFLALNDPNVDYVYEGTAPLTNTTTYPVSNIFAKSAHDDPDAYMVYMTMPESYILTHNHLECGSFQIYYKGILASNSGSYDYPWGSAHHMGYDVQTISKNSILVYNPKLQGTNYSELKNIIYSGGQSIQGLGYPDYPKTLKELLDMKRLHQCVSLGKANVETVIDGEQVYRYSYMGGDMTGAYDEDTVDEVTRYMFSFDTGNPDYPLAFLTFDRITSDEASYHKSSLIHMQMEPQITDDGYIIVTNNELMRDDKGNSTQNNGKMVVQNIGFDTKYTPVGGEGMEFWIPGVDENGNYSIKDGYNLPHNRNLYGNYDEFGWGRVEISPAVAEKTNHILTVMYVTDATNNAKPIAATEIMSDNLVGAYILGKSVIFPKNDKLLEATSTFTLSESQAGECFVTGVKAGSWTITKDGVTLETVTVADGTNLINFVAGAGEYTITPAN